MADIPVEWYRKIKEEVVITARKQNIARKIIPTRGPIGGIGIQQFSYDVLSEVSDAVLTWNFESESEDIVNFTRTNVNIPILHKEFQINRRDLESSRQFGTPLNTIAANSAAYKVTNLENELVILGYSSDGTNYDINGLYNAAGNSVTGSDFGTAGNALSTVADAMAALMDDNIYPPYNLVLHPTQYAELQASIYTGGVSEFDKVKAMIGGDIFVTPFITAGTGMLLARPEARFFELVIAKDLTVETEVLPKTKNLWGIVYEAVVPVVYDSNAICKLTSI